MCGCLCGGGVVRESGGLEKETERTKGELASNKGNQKTSEHDGPRPRVRQHFSVFFGAGWDAGVGAWDLPKGSATSTWKGRGK